MVKNKILKRIVAGLSCIALSTTMLTSLPAFADDYVDEYQYYSTLDPNGEEYQEWKSNLASSAVSVPQNRMLKSILKNNTLIANDYDVELQPNKQFVIHFRLNAADWSNWDTSNDYSMGTEQLLPNDKIIVFYNEQLISGVQP